MRAFRVTAWAPFVLLLASCGISGTGGNSGKDDKGSLEFRNIEVSAISDSAAVIRWNTTGQAVCNLAYGRNPATLTSAVSSGLGTSHTAELKRLDSDTQYHFQITASSPLGPRVVSQAQSFRTTASPDLNDSTPPVISNIQVVGITPNSATVSWHSDDKTRGAVFYGLTTAYGGTANTAAEPLARSHALLLTGLTDDEDYHFRIQATNLASLATYSGDQVFHTAEYPTIEVEPDTIEVAGNEEFTFGIRVRNIANLAGAALVLAYDQQMVEILSVRPGDLWTDPDRGGFIETQSGGDPIAGLVQYNLSWQITFTDGIATGTRANGNGGLAVIRARVQGSRERSTLRLISQAEAQEGETPGVYTRLLDHNRLPMNFNIRNAWVLKRS